MLPRREGPRFTRQSGVLTADHPSLSGEAEFVVDHLNQRFWSLHTTAPTADAAPYLRRVVNQRRDLDWMWLPSDHLQGI